jgi:cytosine deaminase
MDLILKNVIFEGCAEFQDICIDQGVIVKIAENVTDKGSKEIDVSGKLVSQPFIDLHLHLDAALTAGRPNYNMSGTLLEGIEIWSEYKKSMTGDDIRVRALQAIMWEILHGTLYIRTHVDICDSEQKALHVLLQLKEELKDFVSLQIVAFPQDGLLSDKNNLKLMEKALKAGADLVGGIPHNEWTREDGIKSIDILFQLAKEYDKDIDMHIDETDDDHSRFTEYLAAKTIRESYYERVSASHTTAMHSYNNAYAFKLLKLIKNSRINIITNPLDNIALQGRFDTYPKRRGLTRVKEIIEQGINLGMGHDSIMDPWYPLGRGSMLQVAFMCANIAHMTGYNELREIYRAITTNSAKIFRNLSYEIKVGSPANLIIINAKSEYEALRLDPEILYVIKEGRIISTTEPARRFFMDDKIDLCSGKINVIN